MPFMRTVQSADVEHKVKGWPWALFTYPCLKSPFMDAVIQVFCLRGCLFFPFTLAFHFITFFVVFLVSGVYKARVCVLQASPASFSYCLLCFEGTMYPVLQVS